MQYDGVETGIKGTKEHDPVMRIFHVISGRYAAHGVE